MCTHFFYLLTCPVRLHPYTKIRTSPKLLTLYFFELHLWRHPGRAKMLCMLTKMIHKYTTLHVVWNIQRKRLLISCFACENTIKKSLTKNAQESCVEDRHLNFSLLRSNFLTGKKLSSSSVFYSLFITQCNKYLRGLANHETD